MQGFKKTKKRRNGFPDILLSVNPFIGNKKSMVNNDSLAGM